MEQSYIKFAESLYVSVEMFCLYGRNAIHTSTNTVSIAVKESSALFVFDFDFS